MTSPDNRTIVRGIAEDIAKTQCAGRYLSTSFDEISQQLWQTIRVSVADVSSVQEWQYCQKTGSPDRQFKREGRNFEDVDDELLRLFPKRAKSDDASSVSSGPHSSSSSENISPLVPLPV